MFFINVHHCSSFVIFHYCSPSFFINVFHRKTMLAFGNVRGSANDLTAFRLHSEEKIVNEEVFYYGTYNGVEIIQRANDGYINATRLCKALKLDIRIIMRNEIWKETLQAFIKEYGKELRTYYELSNYKEVNGLYIHPKLKNILFMSSPSHMITIDKILDKFDEHNHKTGETMEDIVKRLESEKLKAIKDTEETYEFELEELFDKFNKRDYQCSIYDEISKLSEDDYKITVYKELNKFKISTNATRSFINPLRVWKIRSSFDIKKIVINKFGNEFNDVNVVMRFIDNIIKKEESLKNNQR